MAWFFPKQPASMVEQDITQRDQFSNDDVALSETIIRESVQNSLDASDRDDSPVVVSYRWLTRQDGLDPRFVDELVATQRPHAAAARLDLDGLDSEDPGALIIEDFGTKGLTGKTHEKDNDNFSDFWRRHGKSHKTGKSRGRWGLGKLVYSTTSEIRVFFGVTCREGDPETHLMGQTVLNLRTYEGCRYAPHAFFADMTSDDPQEGIPIPIQDKAFVQEFVRQFQLERNGQPGLSVVIPFPNRSFSIENMIGVSVANYFYPLITGQLKLRFNELEVNSANVRDFARQYANEAFKDIDLLFDFVEEAHRTPESDLLVLKGTWADDKKLDRDDFDAVDLEKIQDRFGSGGLIGLKLPLTLKKKDGEQVRTAFKVFIQRPPALNSGLDIYVRGGLTVSGERKFGSRKAFGVMIAEEESICSFLGDAENAAHTKWIATAEKLVKNYRAPQDKVKVIKNALLNLYDMLAQDQEEEDEKALAKFFSVPEESVQPKKRNKTPPKPEVDPERPAKRRVVLTRIKQGFRISNPPEADDSLYPCVVKVRVAYEVIRGDAFKKYDPLDFGFGGRVGIPIEVRGGCSIEKRAENRFEVKVTGPEFQIEAIGFDETRDLKVDVRAEATGNETDI